MSTLGPEEIMQILAHRYPMLLVDRVVECSQENIVAIKNLTINEPFFQGHFPGFPVMPGVLQLEAMAQAGGVLLSKRESLEGKIPYFMAIDKAKFRKVVRPGDQMRIEVQMLKVRSKVARFAGKVLVDGAVASEAELTCMIGDGQTGA